MACSVLGSSSPNPFSSCTQEEKGTGDEEDCRRSIALSQWCLTGFLILTLETLSQNKRNMAYTPRARSPELGRCNHLLFALGDAGAFVCLSVIYIDGTSANNPIEGSSIDHSLQALFERSTTSLSRIIASLPDRGYRR